MFVVFVVVLVVVDAGVDEVSVSAAAIIYVRYMSELVAWRILNSHKVSKVTIGVIPIPVMCVGLKCGISDNQSWQRRRGHAASRVFAQFRKSGFSASSQHFVMAILIDGCCELPPSRRDDAKCHRRHIRISGRSHDSYDSFEWLIPDGQSVFLSAVKSFHR